MLIAVRVAKDLWVQGQVRASPPLIANLGVSREGGFLTLTAPMFSATSMKIVIGRLLETARSQGLERTQL